MFIGGKNGNFSLLQSLVFSGYDKIGEWQMFDFFYFVGSSNIIVFIKMYLYELDDDFIMFLQVN